MKRDKDSYELTALFGFIFENVVAKEYEFKLILPEGSENIHARLPVTVDSMDMTKTFSYLDIEGRPTLLIRKDKVSKHHNLPF